MDSRERTFLALEHTAGDRIPIDFWATGATLRRLERRTGLSPAAFLDHHDVDLRYIDGPAYVGPPLTKGRDIWGVPRQVVTAAGPEGETESYTEVLDPPLRRAQSVEEVAAYAHWPNPDWFDYRGIARQCEAVRRQKRVAVFMGDRLNRVTQLKCAMYLRGVEEILIDMAAQPEMARAVIDRIRAFYTAYLERILDAAKGGIDIVLTGDDFGTQQGLFVSPGTWRTLLQPGFARYVGLIKSRGAVAMHHTCGAVAQLIPDLIACKLDVLQSIQPEAQGMSLAELKRSFGRALCFHGGVSIQRTLPRGTPDDVRCAVKTIAETVGRDGGYIFCTSHNIQADVPVDNVLALMDAYREFGRL